MWGVRGGGWRETAGCGVVRRSCMSRDVIPATVVGFPTLLSKKFHPCDLSRSIEIFFQGVGGGVCLSNCHRVSRIYDKMHQNAYRFSKFSGGHAPDPPLPLDLLLHCPCDYSKAIFHARALDTLY